MMRWYRRRAKHHTGGKCSGSGAEVAGVDGLWARLVAPKEER